MHTQKNVHVYANGRIVDKLDRFVSPTSRTCCPGSLFQLGIVLTPGELWRAPFFVLGTGIPKNGIVES